MAAPAEGDRGLSEGRRLERRQPEVLVRGGDEQPAVRVQPAQLGVGDTPDEGRVPPAIARSAGSSGPAPATTSRSSGSDANARTTASTFL